MKFRLSYIAILLSVIVSSPASPAPAPASPAITIPAAACESSTPATRCEDVTPVLQRHSSDGPILVNDMVPAPPRYRRPVHPRIYHSRRPPTYYNRPSRQPRQQPQDDEEEEDRPTTSRQPNQMPQDDEEEEERPTTQLHPDRMPQDDEEERPTTQRQPDRMPQDNEEEEERPAISSPGPSRQPNQRLQEIQEGEPTPTHPPPNLPNLPNPVNCASRERVVDEMRLRTMASQASLELLRDYSAALDDEWEKAREKGITGAIVDLASLLPGWPISTPIYNKIMEKFANAMTKTMINAGIKSVEKRLLKDPTLTGFLDQIANDKNLATDLAKAYAQDRLTALYNKEAADTLGRTATVLSTIMSSINGVRQMEAFRIMRKKVEEHIITLQTKHHEQHEMWDTAKEALDLCKFGMARGLPPDPAEYNWVEIRNYLIDHGGGWEIFTPRPEDFPAGALRQPHQE